MINTQVIDDVPMDQSLRPNFEQSIPLKPDADMIVSQENIIQDKRLLRESDSERDRDSVMIELRPPRESV